MTTTQFYDYSFTTAAPLLVGTQDGDPNSVQTAVAVPGSAVRGAVARALAQHAAFERVVLSGAVRFLPAVPTGATMSRSVPVPRSWRADKRNRERVHDSLAADLDPERQWVGIDAPYVTAGPRAIPIVPPIRTAFHHQRDRVRGRATEDTGAVFLYEAIEPGTPFVGTVAITGSDDERRDLLDAIAAAFSRPLQLGRSKSSGYGGSARVTLVATPRARELTQTSVHDLLQQDAEIAAGDTFRLLLTSPAIVRDPAAGQLDPAALATVVGAALQGRVVVERLAVASTLIAGFNATWGKALPQAPAAAAGSVMLFRARAPIAGRELVALEQRGIGERRQDGYGACVWLQPPRFVEVAFGAAHRTDDTVAQPTVWPTTGDAAAILELLQRRLFEAATSRAVDQLAARIVQRATGVPPSRALLGRLRNALRHPEWAETIRAWIPEGARPTTSHLRRPALRALEACRIDDDDVYLDQWLLDIAANENPLCTKRRPKGLADRLFRGDGLDRWRLDLSARRDDRLRALARDARRDLADRVLALLAKRQKE